MEPVGQLDEDDPDVVGHGQDDLADGLGPPDLGRRFLDAADLGHALDQPGHRPCRRPPSARPR